MRPPPSLWERSHNEGYANFEIMGRAHLQLPPWPLEIGINRSWCSHNQSASRKARI